MAKLGTERGSVQNPMLKYAREIGWEYIKPEEVERMRGGKTGLLLRETFTNQILKLNSEFIDKSMVEQLIKKIEKLPVSIEGNLQAWEYVKGLKTIFVPKERRERNVKLINENMKYPFIIKRAEIFLNLVNGNKYNKHDNYIYTTIKKFGELELLTIEKVDRENIIKLTEKGKLIQDLLKPLCKKNEISKSSKT